MWQPGWPDPNDLSRVPCGWTLRVLCGCGHGRGFNAARLAVRFGVGVSADAIVFHMRCSRCGGRPVRAEFHKRWGAGVPGHPGRDAAPARTVAL